MKQWLMCMALLASPLSMAQTKVIPVTDFSAQYRADVTVTHHPENNPEAILRVYRKDNHEMLIEQATILPDEDEQVILTLGGAGQGVLLYEDFDFDGIKDFAIMDNREECYHAPSYTVFVQEGNGFTKNQGLSQLSKNYCGFFQTDAKQQTIRMASKIGCCEHVLETYALVGKKKRLSLQKQEKISIDDSGAYEHWVQTTFKPNGKIQRRQTRAKFIALEQNNFKPIMSFDVEDNGRKTVYVFALPSGEIDVASTMYQTNDVNLSFRMSKIHGVLDTVTPAILHWDKDSNRLCLVHNQVTYTIVDEKTQKGVQISKPSGRSFLAAVNNSQGQLKNIEKTPMVNVQAGVCAK